MNRRDLFGRLAMCLAGTALAKYLPTPKTNLQRLIEARPNGSMVIDRVTFLFWRDQSVTLGVEPKTLRQVFEACRDDVSDTSMK